MEDTLNSIDKYRSIIFIEVGLREASMRQNQWFMGEKEKHEIKHLDASVDWTVHYGAAFSERFRQNVHYILPYVDQHRNEIPINSQGSLVFTDKQFNYLMSKDFKDNPEEVSRCLLAA